MHGRSGAAKKSSAHYSGRGGRYGNRGGTYKRPKSLLANSRGSEPAEEDLQYTESTNSARQEVEFDMDEEGYKPETGGSDTNEKITKPDPEILHLDAPTVKRFWMNILQEMIWMVLIILRCIGWG